MRIKALIVDDEELARDEMRFLLRNIEDVDIAGEARGGEEAVRLVGELDPDLVFLDIQMPVLDGFGVVKSLLTGGGKVPMIIFTTAYDQYAIKAFEVNAVDYLLKPIDTARLREAVGRSRTMLPRREEFMEKMRSLMGNIRIGTRFLPKLVLRQDDGMRLIEVEKIAMLRRGSRGVSAYTSEGTFESNYADIDEIEVQVDPKIFIRLGGEMLVNLRRITQIVPWSGGNYIMTLDDGDGTEVRLSRSQSQLLKNKVEGVF